MGIDRIVKLRDCGIFRGFSWPSDLPDFGRYNLIYGWNASGKTTLSEILRCIELRRPPETGEVSISIDGRECSGSDFQNALVPIRVFNRRFVDENVFRVDGRDMTPIFVIGAESIEKQQTLEGIKTQLTTSKTAQAEHEAASKKADAELERFCSDRARMVKDALRLPGASRYNNYDKADFRKRADRMIEAGDAANRRLTDAARGTLLSQYRAKPLLPIELATYTTPDLHALVADVSSCLETTVVARVIQVLSQDPELADWTHKGLELHRARASSECLFCGQPVPAERLIELEAHFSTEYDRLVADIDVLIGRLEETVRSADLVAVPNRAQLYDGLRVDYDLARTAFVGFIESVKACCTELVAALREKKAHVFKREECGVAALNTDSGLDRLNAVFGRHNRMSADFASVVKSAGEQLEADEVSRTLADYRRLVASKVTAETALQRSRDEISSILDLIRSIEAEITEYRRPAEELNYDLRAYLGHSELQFQALETGYSIKRDGEIARNLSEGECTAIALLYFLKSLSDRRFELTNGIVVIDDPVSSLDANALYLAFAYICDRTVDAAQLFVLTHDFGLFRQIKDWFGYLKGKGAARFYMLGCTIQRTQRCAVLTELDPLLRDYESEYHYLFACVYRAAHASPSACLAESYALPNMARRLLESFFAFHQPHIKGSLYERFQRVDYDASQKRRILRFLHTYSHENAASEPQHDPSVLSETGAVLSELMQLIHHLDAEHFTGMEALITGNAPLPPTGAETAVTK